MGIIKDTVRVLRKNQTLAEKEFWEIVRQKRFLGKRFQRQFPIKYIFRNKSSFFVADFYCHEYKLIVEIDGSIHHETKERDEIREYIVQQYRYKVIRFTNEEILSDKENVIKKLKLLPFD